MNINKKQRHFHLQILREAIKAQKLEIGSSSATGNMHSIAAQSETGRRPSIRYQAEKREYFVAEEIDCRT